MLEIITWVAVFILIGVCVIAVDLGEINANIKQMMCGDQNKKSDPTDDELNKSYNDQYIKGHMISSEDHRSEVESLLAEILTLKELLSARQSFLHNAQDHQWTSFAVCQHPDCVAVKNALEGKG